MLVFHLHGVVDVLLIHVLRPVLIVHAFERCREYAMAETQSTCGERLMDHDQNGTANLIDGHQHRRATDDRSRVIKVAAKRLTNVEVENFTIIVISIDRKK